MVKGITIKKEEKIEDNKLYLCDPYEKGKPLCHVYKKVEIHTLGIYNEIYVDMVMISLLGIRKKKYTIVFIDKAISIR